MEVLGAFRAGVDVILHPHIPHMPHLTHHEEPKIEVPIEPHVTMYQYLHPTIPQPYLMDGSLPPGERLDLGVHPHVDIKDPEDPAGRPKPQGPDFTL